MRLATILACSAGLLVACGRSGDGGAQRAAAGGRDPGQAEAGSGAPGRPAAAAEAVPFGPRGEERRRQDSVLRTGSRHRQKVPSDTT